MVDRENIKREIRNLWKQKMYCGAIAKLNWLNWGDKNSQYFHASVVQRRGLNNMITVKDDDGK